MEFKKTIFLDIDGCIFRHKGNLSTQILQTTELLPGVTEKLNDWEAKGHKIILVTGRKESMRKITEEQLSKAGIFYDQLVMGMNRGERILINDKKPENANLISSEHVASAIEITRNEGLKNINI
jgi:hydroxymethylpyrimidine pyrophosphatase-like HAD family hydrolase